MGLLGGSPSQGNISVMYGSVLRRIWVLFRDPFKGGYRGQFLEGLRFRIYCLGIEPFFPFGGPKFFVG